MGVVSVDSAVRDFPGDYAGGYTNLADLLWRQRELLEQVLFELAVEQLVVSSGQARWLPTANRRLDRSLEQLRATELARSMESETVCEHLGVPGSTTLSEIAALVAQPWDSILLEHREALLDLATEVRASADQNRRLLDAASRSVRETLASITASVGTYDASGLTSNDFIRPSRIDEQA